MGKKEKQPSASADPRCRSKEEADKLRGNITSAPMAEVEKLVHELQAHQVELEM